jgi:Zn-finger nucleic acid-binding protein
MRCPACEDELCLKDHRGVVLGTCPRCEGVWLDRDGLKHVLGRSWPGGGRATAPVATAGTGSTQWQLDIQFFDFG